MYLKIDGQDCWVIAPNEHELKALRWQAAHARFCRKWWVGLVTVALIFTGITLAGMFAVMIGGLVGQILGAVVGTIFMITPLIWYIGGHRWKLLRVLELLQKNGRVIRLWRDPIGIALREHVLFTDAWQLNDHNQRLVMEWLSKESPSQLDDFLSDADNYAVLSKLIGIERPSAAYDLFQTTLWRRAAEVFVAMGPYAKPLFATDQAERVAATEARSASNLERRSRQLAEARVFSLLDTA